MKRLISLVLIVSCIFTFSNCSENEVNQIKPYFHFTEDTNTSPEFDANGGTSSVSFETSHNWTASSNQSWITLSRKLGTPSNANFTIIVNENESTAPRDGEVEIISNNEAFTIYIRQMGKDDVIYYNSIDGNIVNPYSESAFNVSIVSNTYNNGLGTITFNGKLTSIGTEAFYNCSNLTRVTIPNTVTTIGEEAFCGCSNLTSVTIPDSVTTIGEEVFSYCTNLTNITIPDSVTTIGYGAFAVCLSLTEFKGKLASDDGRCLIIDSMLNSFAPAGLTEYTIPDSVTIIGPNAFSQCSNLTSVTIPDSVTTIGYNAFIGCKYITSIIIPDSVTEIGMLAFAHCDRIRSVNIPNSVTFIADGVFYDSNKLTNVYCEAITPPSLGGDGVFRNTASDIKIYVPYESVDAYKNAEYWSGYASAIVGYDY